jgi:hypothetical protein
MATLRAFLLFSALLFGLANANPKQHGQAIGQSTNQCVLDLEAMANNSFPNTPLIVLSSGFGKCVALF